MERSRPRRAASAYARATACEQCFWVIYITSAQPPSAMRPSRAVAACGVFAKGSGLCQPAHRHAASAYARATACEQCFRVIDITSAQPPSASRPSRAVAACGVFAKGGGLCQHAHRHAASAYARATACEQCVRVIAITSAQPPSAMRPSRAVAACGLFAKGGGLCQHAHRHAASAYACATACE
jgi:hypothetical protein